MLRQSSIGLLAAAFVVGAVHAYWAPFPSSGDSAPLDPVAYHDRGLPAVIRFRYYAAPPITVLLAVSLETSV